MRKEREAAKRGEQQAGGAETARGTRAEARESKRNVGSDQATSQRSGVHVHSLAIGGWRRFARSPLGVGDYVRQVLLRGRSAPLRLPRAAQQWRWVACCLAPAAGPVARAAGALVAHQQAPQPAWAPASGGCCQLLGRSPQAAPYLGSPDFRSKPLTSISLGVRVRL